MRARDQADVLLQRLLRDRRQSEARFAEAGKHDPLKNLTGSSSLDRAIDATREMIRHMDDLLRELEAETSSVNGAGSNGTINGAPDAAPVTIKAGAIP